MRVVTVQYSWIRRHSVRSIAPWWILNEIRQMGYLTLPRPWEMSPCYHFSVVRWLNPDGGSLVNYSFLEPMPRFSEADVTEVLNWEHVRHPWNDEEVKPIEQFHTSKERMRHLFGQLDKAEEHLNHGKVMVMHLPYGGLPLVSVISTTGKVTIF